MRVLVTGGAGYIGSVVTEECIAAGHETFVVDNLVKGHRWMVNAEAGFFEADINDTAAVRDILRLRSIDAVIHMAAYSLVGESMTDPAAYYHNNLTAGLSLLNAMRDCEVKKLIFSSTAAVYGEPEKQSIEETAKLQPTNTYGETKLAFEKALHWFDLAHGLKYASLRYFNAAGATEKCGELHDPETHLVPLVLDAAGGASEAVQIFGDDYPTKDGTCVRDYIHVKDLANAHVLALNKLETGSEIYNLGCGGGYSVKEVIDAARKVTGRDIKVRVGGRRAGDPAVLVASSEKIQRELGWQPKLADLETIIRSAWDWTTNYHSAADASSSAN
jgi:UDP-glucose 4-epimerase